MNATMHDERPLPPPPPPPGNGDETGTPWYRVPVSRDPDGVIGGVVSGIARAYGFDVRTTRVAVVILTLVLPVLLLAYVAAWVLLPTRPDEATGLEQIARDRSRLPLYIALGALAIVAGIGSIGSWVWFGTFPWPLALIAVGVLLWAAPTLRSGADSRSAAPSAAPFAPPSAPTTTGAGDPGGDAASDPGAPDAPGGAGTAPSTRTGTTSTEPRRPGIPIGGSVALLALLGVAVAISGQAAGWWSVSILAVIVIGLVATSVAGILSALVNRSWYLLLPVVPVALFATALSITQPNLDGGIGDRTRVPVASEMIDGSVSERLAIGQLTIDLRELDLAVLDAELVGEPVVVDARVGMGQLRVIVPDDVSFVLDGSVGAGQIEVDGRNAAAGFRPSDQRRYGADDPTGEVVLRLEVGLGQIEIDVRSPRR